MRENPSQGYIEWALSRFGPEWVEANLPLEASSDGHICDITTTKNLEKLKKPVSARRASPLPRVYGRKVLLAAFCPTQQPSVN